MAYSTQADLAEQVSEAELTELTDDVGAGIVDASVAVRALADADGEIDSYCGSRYTVPFMPVPVMIRKLAVDIALYNLYTRRAILKMPEERQKRYDNAIRFLRDLAKGLIALGADSPAEPNGGKSQATTTKPDRIFSTGKSGSVGTLDNY
jgi:phage gp36-like protein